MVKRSQWRDEFWLPVMQLYLKKPEGVKPAYARDMVNLSMELHIPPAILFERMNDISQLSTPRLVKLWQHYGKSRSKLSRAVKLFRKMNGFNNADTFYEGVHVNETFERDFREIEENPDLKPFMLVIILDLYYQLTPITMTSDTPEVIELASLMKIKPELITDILYVFQHCDPYLHREDIIFTPLLIPCRDIWKRYGNLPLEEIHATAEEYKDYFK
jgi:hypothetical protein